METDPNLLTNGPAASWQMVAGFLGEAAEGKWKRRELQQRLGVSIRQGCVLACPDLLTSVFCSDGQRGRTIASDKR